MAGPLTGYRIIEIAGIGPGPFAAMLLADMGAEVIRVDRAGAVRGPLPDGRALRRAAARPPQRGVDLKHPDGVEALLTPRRVGRRADRGVPPRRDGAARRRPRRVPRPQPEARVRAHDRLGPGRPVRPGRRPRHQLHRARRRARALRPGRRGAGAAAQPGRRLRRRRHVPRLRRGVRAARGAAQRPGPGRRRGDGRRRRGADVDVLGVPVDRHVRRERPGTNLLDTGAHFYDVYRCSDGKYISLGSIEPQFYAELLRLTGLEGDDAVRASRWTRPSGRR